MGRLHRAPVRPWYVMRFDRLLSSLGICTRSQARKFLKFNKVMHKGKPLHRVEGLVDASKIEINGKPLNYKPVHIALYKPSGYICSTVPDGGEGKTVYDLLPGSYIHRTPTLAIAGRLDKWVTGLVVLSQNGLFVNRLCNPRRLIKVPKVYEVTLKFPLNGTEKEQFNKGIMLRSEDVPCLPAEFEVLDLEERRCRITIYEGRYHQVRRMVAAVNNFAQTVHRISIGDIHLGNMKPGEYRYLREEEMDFILDQKEEENEMKEMERLKKKYNPPDWMLREQIKLEKERGV